MGSICQKSIHTEAADLSGYWDCAVCPQCIIIKSNDLYGHMKRCNWNCAEHKLGFKIFFGISVLRHGEVISLASKEKVASCFLN